ncbi:PilN domain-containing protein [Verminephrobacter aporrectodeae]|uniref:PilN domain-containing protein n=1 Tax=Verminephrobacter aporrectodeae TaxID=1110389 RepID=UPI0002377368|nr:PilN domain-containing protein [Verminephrobacter aporrectodeae]MCW8166900.1 fimbrial protein [Verminephrobacter aporrectodeae subsp. tuberculatae]MCW8171083.1 fimbrial protein [Verminephrobacter aporrectodeae subsp. tuberculatae]MCW8177402.1 fimbrial protein [Verminephrobacter aporrectodeae subsp. tuberculatae]MCW8200471.1 fimbrial protein [Verminephrobacter aporrectodeae subsp. tuberculatae]MCW8204847.1 fimbrial protein [Verminephrobacter aporrectodeae subsp. tuberculatae]
MTTAWGQLTLRAQAALDRLAWGLGDLRRVLVERGAWPARRHSAVAADGGLWCVTGSQLRKRGDKRRADCLLIPESDCLWGSLQLPALPRRALDGAVEEALWRVSPLPPEQIVAAWRAELQAPGEWAVHWGLCRRSAQDQWLAHSGLPADTPVYLVHQDQALPVRGPAWRRQAQRQRRVDCAALGLALLLLLALALPAFMPLILKHQAVVRAKRHVGALEQRTAALRQELDELRRQAALAQELRKNLGTDLPLASVIDALSEAIPADAWLDRVEISGNAIRIVGLTGDAGALIAQLGRQSAFSDVHATAATVRDATVNKERFIFELRWRGAGAAP